MIFEEILACSYSGETEDNRKIVHFISELMHTGQWTELDACFAQLNEHRITTVALLCWLRVAWPIHDKLPHWRKLLYRAREMLNSRGENADHILRGLL